MSDGPAAADHLSLDALAELQEGIADDAAALQRHLDSCPTCRKRAGQLHASRALLSTLPPDPMPADVAARIDAALAAERGPTAKFAGGGDIVPMRPRRPWWRSPNLAAAAAGVAVVGLASALVVGHLGGKSAPSAEDKSTGGNAAGPLAAGAKPGTVKQWQTGANYTKATQAGLVTGLVLGDPPPFSANRPQTGAQAGPTTSTTGTSSSPESASYTQAQLRDVPTLFDCARLLAGHPVQPLAVDYARYDGTPAVILVLPSLSKSSSEFDAYAIRSTCSNDAGDIVFFRVPR